MLRSMTGYGCAQGNGAGFDISVDIRSVNHRYFECVARLPKAFLFLEDPLKKRLQGVVARGKIEISLSISAAEEKAVEVTVDQGVARNYLEALRNAGEGLGLIDELKLSHLLRFPELFTIKRAELDEEAVSAAVFVVMDEAVASFQTMREMEGSKLKEDLLGKLSYIGQLVGTVEEMAPERQTAYYSRLYQKLSELLGDREVDEARLITEAAIFADKVAVDEETVRLRSHIQQFSDLLGSEEPSGKKLDFLIQEMNREANTIGSKGQEVRIARVVVELKSSIEKLREQIQNIE